MRLPKAFALGSAGLEVTVVVEGAGVASLDDCWSKGGIIVPDSAVDGAGVTSLGNCWSKSGTTVPDSAVDGAGVALLKNCWSKGKTIVPDSAGASLSWLSSSKVRS